MRLALLAAVMVVALSACGSDDVRERVDEARAQVEKQVERRVEQARKEFEQRRERFGKRIEEVLGDLERAVPRAERTSPTVRSRGRNEPTTIDAFLTDVLQDVDGYWTRTFKASGLPEPRVRYVWVSPGARVLTGCGAEADDRAAFYCPADDTIYVAQRFAAALYQGVAEGLPGESTGSAARPATSPWPTCSPTSTPTTSSRSSASSTTASTRSAKPFELQADCFAGTWANSVYEQGQLQPGDLEEAANAALAVGDFDVGNAQHHGTPQERRDALLAGFDSGDPSVCARYVAAG